MVVVVVVVMWLDGRVGRAGSGRSSSGRNRRRRRKRRRKKRGRIRVRIKLENNEELNYMLTEEEEEVGG